MRLFLIQFGDMVPAQIDVARALKKNHTIQYWVRITSHFTVDGAEFPGTVFHEYLDAVKGAPARGVDPYKYEPWSARDIAEYADVESEFMSMADKLYPDWPVNKRKDLYYDMLRYWGGVLDEFKPDCIIIIDVPHHGYNFVLYSIAKHRRVRTIVIENTLANDRYVLSGDYTIGSERLKLRDSGFQNPVTIDDLSPEIRRYYEIISKGKNPTPAYTKAFFDKHTWRYNLLRWTHVSTRFIKDRTLFERAVMKMLKMMKPSVRDELKASERPANLEEPYVYFPLHYQPELTTSPLGGVYVDQLLAIKTAAAALPEGWELYVKEQPGQLVVHGGNFTPARYSGFYASIAAIPHVRLVPLKTNTFSLIDHAQTTATITGTAGWESILRGKAAIVFGYPWYLHAPGVIRVASVEECKSALARIASGFAPHRSDIFRYLQLVDRFSRRGNLVKSPPDDAVYARDMHEALEEMLASA